MTVSVRVRLIPRLTVMLPKSLILLLLSPPTAAALSDERDETIGVGGAVLGVGGVLYCVI